MPLESKFVQRRNAVRERFAIRPRIARVVYSDVAYRNVRLGITNLSATGVSVRSRDELRAGDLVELMFELDGEQFHVQARVRRVLRRDRVWDAGCAFEGVAEPQAERIVKFIFTQQRFALRARRDAR